MRGMQMRCITTGLLAQDCDHCKQALGGGCTCGHDGLGPEWHATGCPQGEPGPAVPPGGEELRAALEEAIFAGVLRQVVTGSDFFDALYANLDPRPIVQDLLALPEMRDALAAQQKLRSYANDPAPTSQQLRDLVIRNRELEKKLRRVEALAEEYDANLNWREWGVGARLRRALDGDRSPAGFCTCQDDAPMRDCGVPQHRATARAMRGES